MTAVFCFSLLTQAHTPLHSTSGVDELNCPELPLLVVPTAATKVTVQTTDPGYPAASGVSKTGSPASGDLVVVDLIEQGTTAQGKVLVVCKVKANSGLTAAVSGDGSVMITASGNSNTYYVVVELATADASNWTAKINTSGGSGYTFRKGNGG